MQRLTILISTKCLFYYQRTFLLPVWRYASAAFGIIMFPSIRLSVCLSQVVVLQKRLNLGSRKRKQCHMNLDSPGTLVFWHGQISTQHRKDQQLQVDNQWNVKIKKILRNNKNISKSQAQENRNQYNITSHDTHIMRTLTHTYSLSHWRCLHVHVNYSLNTTQQTNWPLKWPTKQSTMIILSRRRHVCILHCLIKWLDTLW